VSRSTNQEEKQASINSQGSHNFRGKNTKTIFQATGISWQVHNTLFTDLFLACGIEGTEDSPRAIESASQRARTRRERRCCFGSGRARGDTPGPARVRLSGRRCLKHPARPGIPGAFDRHNRTFLRPFRSLGLGLRVGSSLWDYAFSSTCGIDHPK